MFHYVTDKVFLKESYSVCADTVNQLVQKLKSYGIQSSMSVVGSKKYDLITQNEKEPIDYDFNLWIESAENIMSDPRQLKCTIMEAFNEVLRHKGWGTCNDSTSALTTKKQVLDKKNKTPFSIDVCIVRSDSCANWYRLIHSKTGYIQDDQYYWSMGLFVKELEEKEAMEQIIARDYESLESEIEEYLKENNQVLEDFFKEIILKSKLQTIKFNNELKPISLEDIKNVFTNDKEKFIEKYHIKNIYLFGSFAKEIERLDSDIDLLVRFNEGNSYERKKEIMEYLNSNLSLIHI